MFKAKLKSGVSSSSMGSPGGAVMNCECTKKKLNAKSNIKIDTWNVRTLAQFGKAHNAINEMERLKIHILGISEMRGPGSNFFDINDHRIYYSRTTNGKHEYGVGVIINKTIATYVTNFIPISERIMLLQIQTTPANINVIQVYAPTCQSDEDEIKEFYSQIIEVLKLPKQDLAIIMGDWNAKIGK
uniref:Endonuclease/exonuclease/phosphatase domain-containing protein n=1 Tax=Dendroctonus ponderosae TaxID=77166 RepID=A0AAR5NZ92_DENPD